MTGAEARYAVKTAEVAAKVIDAEAIAINLTTGTYYSLDGAAGRIWALIEQRLAVAEIARVIAQEYEVAEDTSKADVHRLIDQLVAEGLIIATTEPAGAAAVITGGKRAWVSPALNIYRDMADLLALDPPVPGLELAEREAPVTPQPRR